jgi:hypothetical protein
LDLAVRQGLSLYTTDRACGTVDTTVLAPAGDKSIVDAPAKKQQKGDFIFRCALSPNHAAQTFRALVPVLADQLMVRTDVATRSFTG